jgi:TetR/AcrR family fatty acid metabolism transcriptional regulator
MEKPTSKRKEREREARREAILDAAARVFSRKSYHEATLEEIATEAELAKGTLYNYYPDKQNIFASLMGRGHEQYQQQLNRIIDESKTLQEFIRWQIETSLEILADNKYMFRMIMTAGAHLSEEFHMRMMGEMKEQVERAASKLADALTAFEESRGLSEDERLAGANMILGLIRFLHLRRMISCDQLPPPNNVEHYTRLLYRALAVEQTP